MIRRSIQAWWLVLVLLCAVFAAYGVQGNESVYPLGTSFASYVDFSSSPRSKDRLVELLSQTAKNTPSGSFLLTKADPNDVADGLNVYWFGAMPRSASTVRWFKNGRHASIMSARDLGLSNLSGSYSFYSQQDASIFAADAKNAGAAVETRGRRTVFTNVGDAINGNVGVVFLLLSLLFLSSALFWTWAGSKNASRSIRLLHGKSKSSLYVDDIESLVRMSCPWALGAATAGGCVVSVVHGFRSVTTFLGTYATLLACLVGAVLVLSFAFLAVFTPSVRGISARRDGLSAIRRGNNALKLLCVFMALLSLPLSMDSAQQAVKENNDADAWRQARSAVTFDVQPAYQQEQYVTNFQRLFARAEHDGILALSYSVGSMLVRTSGPSAPSQQQVDAQLAPFDDVIITTPSFLNLLHVNRAQMHAIGAKKLPSVLGRALSDYREVWFNEDAGTDPYRMYTWSGDSSFPVLLHSPQPGSLATTHHPLILVVDAPSRTMSVSGFLIPCLTSGNMLFTEVDTARKDISASGLDRIIYSASTVADAALYESQQLRNAALVDITAAVFCILTGLFCSWQSARIWAFENRRRIFIRHTSGLSYWSIARRRLFVQTAYEIAAAMVAAAICVALFMMIGQISVTIVAALALVLFGWVALLVSTRTAFSQATYRQE